MQPTVTERSCKNQFSATLIPVPAQYITDLYQPTLISKAHLPLSFWTDNNLPGNYHHHL